MDLINGTRYALSVDQVLDKDGRPWLVAVAKSTWQLEPDADGKLTLAAKQRPLRMSDVHEGEPGLSAPLFESDYTFRKAACDVLFKGAAHSPEGKPVKILEAGLRIGPIHKVLRVVGNRPWQRKLGSYWTPGSPEPFVQLPITYGNAFGGMYTPEQIGSSSPDDYLSYPDNLVGRGYAKGAFQGLLADTYAPNLEAMDEEISAPDGRYKAVSLGPIARNCPPRLRYAGTYDQRWQEEVFPLLPKDFDERFYQSAPPDQQMPYPTGGEQIALLNLTLGGGLKVITLPRLRLPMVALTRERRPIPLHTVVDTLIFDTDAMVLEVVWRACHPLKRNLQEIHTLAAGNVCKRWWKSRVYGAEDCGCHGIETDDKDLAPVTEALEEDDSIPDDSTPRSEHA
ncbi:DUF2169 domain-containing protein [Chitinimonas viridis]|uniref:DUF2169 domain-containing protein n=2 Tax=Chitinimonas TaxID=240411 RepID=A0ABT8B6H0_9NEIS|nr:MULTISPECIES: DUF2169 domain-containing protein [Chitinimonas]MDN3577731.1 DUF2169 domain-containing protein [Chitinimonas viridis]GLR15281.1 hypothetical protein GCM10007907_40710 [Chitinimonas prasina]